MLKLQYFIAVFMLLTVNVCAMKEAIDEIPQTLQQGDATLDLNTKLDNLFHIANEAYKRDLAGNDSKKQIEYDKKYAQKCIKDIEEALNRGAHIFYGNKFGVTSNLLKYMKLFIDDKKYLHMFPYFLQAVTLLTKDLK